MYKLFCRLRRQGGKESGFFVAGWRTGRKTSRIDMSALAGFWADVAIAVFWVASLVLLAVTEFVRGRGGISEGMPLLSRLQHTPASLHSASSIEA